MEARGRTHPSGTARAGSCRPSLKRRLATGLALLLIVGPTLQAHAHTACDVSGSNPVIHDGDEHANVCDGSSSSDSMYGRGAGDDLSGFGGRDKLRGATGGDLLTDHAGQDDNDSTCDGNGDDDIHVDDGDTRDDVHLVTGDGFVDFVHLDSTAELGLAYEPNNCPIPAP